MVHVGSVAFDQIQIDEEPRTRRTAATGSRLEVSPRKRIVEVLRTHIERQAAAPDRHTALELVDGDIDAVS